MKSFRTFATFVFCLGILLSITYAEDESEFVGGLGGTAGGLESLGDVDNYMDFSSSADISTGLVGGTAGVPTDISTFGAVGGTAGVPTDISTFGAVGGTAGIPTDVSAAYYTTVAPPASQQNTLLTYDVTASPPAAVYYSGSMVPWAGFSLGFAPDPQFWVVTPVGWKVYAVCPLGGWARYMLYVPFTGALKMYEIYPSGAVKFYNYGWVTPGFKALWFIGDAPGRHITFFTVSDRPSNIVTIDVR